MKAMLRKHESDKKNNGKSSVFGFGDKTILDKNIVSTDGRYAMAGLATAALASLFPGEQWKQFNKDTINEMLVYLNMPTERYMMIFEHMLDFGPHPEETYHSFTSIINDEEHCNENLIVQDLVYFALRHGCYDSRLRVMIKTAIRCFRELPPDQEYNILEIFEELFINECFTGGRQELTEEERTERMRLTRRKQIRAAAAIGTSTVIFGALMGLLRGLTGSFLASAGGMALVGSLFAITGSGLAGYKMNRRAGRGMETFKFEVLTNIVQLHVTIAIAGWLPPNQKENGFREPWKTLWHSKQQFFLIYETSNLLRLGEALRDMYQKMAVNAVQRTLARTVMSGLMAAIALPAYLKKFADVIDNPWGVCTSKAVRAGQELADVLQSRVQGKRPVSLIGFSIGARVIFFCLQELAQRKGCENIVQDAVLLGAPVTSAEADWKNLCNVVSGRIVNGYCTNDWVLMLVHRASAATLGIAGLKPIELDDRRMDNVDLTEIVDGHLDYPNKIPAILKKLGIRTHGGEQLVERPQQQNSIFYVSRDDDDEAGPSVEMQDFGKSAADCEDGDIDGARYEEDVMQDFGEPVLRTENSTFFVSLDGDNNDINKVNLVDTSHQFYDDDSDDESHFADAHDNLIDLEDD